MASNKQRIEKPTASLGEIVGQLAFVSEKLGEWICNSNSLSVLVAGKAGTGKSTLINGLIGKMVAKEGDKLTPMTSRVQHYKLRVNEITVHIFDSPGLQDKTDNEEKYLSEIRKKCNNVDLFLYCIKMSETRFFPECDDAVAMQRLYKALGPQLWENGLIILTFGNELIGLAKTKGKNVTEYFQGQFTKIVTKVRTFLCEQVNIEKGVVDNIPIVCAGHVNVPLLPSISDEDLASACDRQIHWLSYLWLKALHQTRLNAQPAMVKLNLHRLLTDDSQYTAKESSDAFHEVIAQQPIMLSQQGAEIGKELGELGKDVGSSVGEKMGKDIATHMAVQRDKMLVMNLLLTLAKKLTLL